MRNVPLKAFAKKSPVKSNSHDKLKQHDAEQYRARQRARLENETIEAEIREQRMR